MLTQLADRPLRILSVKEVCKRTSFSKASIYRLVSRDQFPKPVQMSDVRRGWVESEVEQWLAARIAERDRPTEATP